ncbi:IS110 family transposase [Streptomyces sp. NRRL S-337]|nr:IS110 family transposase [Streptomyces sp. NRRL S-337]
MATIWAGIDAGKTHHHCVAIDENGVPCEGPYRSLEFVVTFLWRR